MVLRDNPENVGVVDSLTTPEDSDGSLSSLRKRVRALSASVLLGTAAISHGCSGLGFDGFNGNQKKKVDPEIIIVPVPYEDYDRDEEDEGIDSSRNGGSFEPGSGSRQIVINAGPSRSARIVDERPDYFEAMKEIRESANPLALKIVGENENEMSELSLAELKLAVREANELYRRVCIEDEVRYTKYVMWFLKARVDMAETRLLALEEAEEERKEALREERQNRTRREMIRDAKERAKRQGK